LNRNKDIVLKDVTDLKKAVSLTEHIMTCYPAEATAKGEVTVYYKDKDNQTVPFVIKYNDKQMEAEVEKIKLETLSDQGVLSSWGDVIHRINFKVKNPKLKDTYSFIIKKK
ncbi:MAG: hypothetical protein LBT50_06955, partial [Prevotellaceae bacterium]|nr:hypothetical protein [Prevotellaceae bacterium]